MERHFNCSQCGANKDGGPPDCQCADLYDQQVEAKMLRSRIMRTKDSNAVCLEMDNEIFIVIHNDTNWSNAHGSGLWSKYSLLTPQEYQKPIEPYVPVSQP
jgi:hypothetical protein